MQHLLADLGEQNMLRRLCAHLPRRRDVIVGAGDDCAVLRSAGSRYDWLLKSDPVIEGKHFTTDTLARAIGHKALGRALSDIAAMGGEPLWTLVNIVAPPRTPAERILGIMRGLKALAGRCGMAVVGGDLSAGPVLEMHVFVVGRVGRGRAILRSGARPGDSLFVTGALGGSLAGRHLKFNPRLAEGRWLRGRARAMIDLSDGLATDLRHLIRSSRVGAELWLETIPIARAARLGVDRQTALRRALTDGEDYELLFTVAAAQAHSFERAWRKVFELPCTPIGVISGRRGLIETISTGGQRGRLTEEGFQHFR